MAITQSQYTAADKVVGDIFSSEEHNELKSVLNKKTDSENTILIEGDQSIDGNLSVYDIAATSGTFSGRITITDNDDQIRFISNRTDGNTSLNRDTFIMTKADSNLDFYVYSLTDNAGKFSVDKNGKGWFAGGLEVNAASIIKHVPSTDSKALTLSSGTVGGDTDLVFYKNSKNSARIRLDSSNFLRFSVIGNSNTLKSRIVLGSGSNTGVALFESDLEIKSLRTNGPGVVIPSRIANSTYDNTGLYLSSNTSTGFAGTVNNASGSIFFKEADKFGFAIDYFGETVGDTLGNKLYINRYNNTTAPIPVMSFPRVSTTVEFWGNISGQFKRNSDGFYFSKTWFKNYGAGSNDQVEAVIEIDGTLVIGAGESGSTTMAAIGAAGTSSAVPERLYLTSDTDIRFVSNTQNGYASRKEMVLATTGDLTIPGISYATNFQFTSDITLKNNIKPLTTELDINFIEFTFKNSDIKRYGVSAQEVQKVLPELVSKDANGDLTVSMVDLLVLKVAELERKLKEALK